MEEIKEKVEEKEETKEEEKQEPTKDEIKTNEELLKANAEISDLRKRLDDAQKLLIEKEEKAKEDAFNNLLTKYKVKPEFHQFIKFELRWQEISDLDKELSEFIAKNPALTEPITTGGIPEEKKSGEPEKSENPLLKWKEENNL